MKITDALLQLKQVIAELDGEVLSITLDKKAIDNLNKECQQLCSHCCCGVCPTFGRVTDNKVFGIKIFGGHGL